MASTDVAEPDDDAPKGKRARTEEKDAAVEHARLLSEELDERLDELERGRAVQRLVPGAGAAA